MAGDDRPRRRSAEEEERGRREAQIRRENTFAAVAGTDFIRLAVIGPDPSRPKQRKGEEVKRDLEREFVLRWKGAPSPTSRRTMWSP